MTNLAKILNIDPTYGIPGGEIVIECEGLDTRDLSTCAVVIGDWPASIVALGPRRVLAIVPETKAGRVPVRLSGGGYLSEPAYFTVARKLASRRRHTDRKSVV